MLDAVLSAWHASQVDQIVLVVRQVTAEEQESGEAAKRLIDIARCYRVHVIAVDQPPDMKASVIAGVDYLTKRFAPAENAHCFVAPADLPTLNSGLIDQLLAGRQESKIVVPRFGQRSGHPVLFPWKHLLLARELGPEQGIKALIEADNHVSLEFPEEVRVSDMDTLEDYQRLLASAAQRNDAPS